MLTHDEILDDVEYDCTYALHNPKFKCKFKLEYPTKETDWNKVYRDMSPVNIRLSGFQMFSAFLETGIKRIDSWFGREIRRDKESKFTYEQLERAITHCPHLHNIIKTNLLDNLKNFKNGNKEA